MEDKLFLRRRAASLVLVEDDDVAVLVLREEASDRQTDPGGGARHDRPLRHARGGGRRRHVRLVVRHDRKGESRLYGRVRLVVQSLYKIRKLCEDWFATIL